MTIQTVRQAGFTLIELLLYVAIVSSLLLSVVGFYEVALDARYKNQAVSEVNQQGVLVMDQITQSIRNSTSLSLPLIATNGPVLTMVVPTASLSPTTYALNGTALQITEGSNAAVILTNSRVKVSSLTFTNLSRAGTPGIIQVSFVMAYVNSTGRTGYDFSRTFTSSAEVQW